MREDLNKISFFRNKFPRAIGYFDNSLLVYDISPSKKSASPFEIRLVWGKYNNIKVNPFPKLLESKYVKKYTENDNNTLDDE